MNCIRNIIFDLGGVLYAIDFERTAAAFNALVGKTVNFEFSLTHQAEIFQLYEAGHLTTPEFREQLRSLYQFSASDQQIDNAWNTTLQHLFPESIELIQSLKKKYKLVLLSNTNELHHQVLAAQCSELFTHFNYCFFSYKLGLCKPHAEIFNLVLNQMCFLPQETMLVDDSPLNIAAAQAFGLHAYHVHAQQSVSELVITLL